MVQLPKYVSGGEAVEYFSVPREWNEHRKIAKSVQGEVINKYTDDTGIYGVGLTRSPKTYGGKNGLGVELIVDETFENLAIPAEVDGIPITLEVGEPGQLGGCSISSGTANCVNKEGDTTVNPAERVSGANSAGTAAMQMGGGSNQYLLTCAHLFRDSCTNNVNGKSAYTADGDKIGEVSDSNSVDDWAVIDLGNGSTSTQIDDNANYPTCTDAVSEATLQNWESQSKSSRPCLYQMGCTTGKTTGRLKYANFAETTFNGCVDYNDDGSADGVYTYCGFGQGDSGGPTWHMDGGNAHLVSTTALYHGYSGSVCGGNDFGPDSSGMGAYAIEDVTGYSVP
ncbi:hypothetical protein SAMN04487948_11046 [Halogranum amylolyticum]|uniref:Trypsin n=1 Tax=Halogranum amylolyticum TaxID=660520 RepID=A0A1H8U9Y8_9EURY|nr:hypothetical protein [Halogranum amylolyticum]SEP00039.1 hypothetical protein SAMN04487948_11046 [Halogranum amylolyticum]